MLPSAYQLPAGVLLVAIGLLACVAGYRFFRAILATYGFVIGAFVASTLVAPSDTLATIVALGVGGLLGALALYAGYFVGVALAGAGLGATRAGRRPTASARAYRRRLAPPRPGMSTAGRTPASPCGPPTRRRGRGGWPAGA